MKSRNLTLILPGLLILGTPGWTQEGPKPPGGQEVWDTGKPSTEPLAPAAFAERKGWAAIAGEKSGAFKGDAVVTNDRLFLVARKGAPSAELHSAGAGGVVLRAKLVPQAPGGDSLARIEAATLIENSKGSAALEVSGKTAKGADLSVKLKLKRGDPFIEALAGTGADRLRLESPGRFVVLPDFFADDIMIDATKVSVPTADLPSENFLLHLAGERDVIAMSVYENREQDVRITFSGQGNARVVSGSETEFGKKGGRIWVAILEAPRIWHATDLERKNVGKVTPLEWKMPFTALWRTDFTRTDELIDSWEMLLQEKEGGDYLKPTWFGSGEQRVRANRQHFDQAIGGLLYPAWSDSQGMGYVQPFNEKGKMEMTFRGPMVLYPINRLKQTPPDVFTVVDIVRNTLGVGPCEYVLDVEGQKSALKGRATCSVREELRMIYEAHEQKRRKADIERFLQQGLTFVKHIRSRIEGYVDFAHKMREAVAAEKRKQPELAEPLGQLDKLLAEVDVRVDAKRGKIKTPDYVAATMDDFRKNVMDYEGPDALDRANKFSEALVEIGGTQDELAGECRWLVKNLRQRAALMTVQETKLAGIAGTIRQAAQQVLRAPSVHEKARH